MKPGVAGKVGYPGKDNKVSLPTLKGLRHLLSTPPSLSKILIHMIVSTKSRVPFLHETAMREKTLAYLGGTAKPLGCQPIIIGTFEHHQAASFPEEDRSVLEGQQIPVDERFV